MTQLGESSFGALPFWEEASQSLCTTIVEQLLPCLR